MFCRKRGWGEDSRLDSLVLSVYHRLSRHRQSITDWTICEETYYHWPKEGRRKGPWASCIRNSSSLRSQGGDGSQLSPLLQPHGSSRLRTTLLSRRKKCQRNGTTSEQCCEGLGCTIDNISFPAAVVRPCSCLLLLSPYSLSHPLPLCSLSPFWPMPWCAIHGSLHKSLSTESRLWASQQKGPTKTWRQRLKTCLESFHGVKLPSLLR